METRRTLLVDAFADEPLAGNVAGVVPDVGELSEDRMGRIAAELGASETAFLLDAGEGADERLRFSLPQPRSIDLWPTPRSRLTAPCSPRARSTPATAPPRTNVGDLEITIDDDGTVWMRQNPPTVDVIEPDSGSDGDSGGGLDDGTDLATRWGSTRPPCATWARTSRSRSPRRGSRGSLSP